MRQCNSAGESPMSNWRFNILRAFVFWGGASFTCDMLIRMNTMVASLVMGLIIGVIGYCFFEIDEQLKEAKNETKRKG
jgi:hypothetical protein